MISPHSYNHPHGKSPGRVLVIPFSMTGSEKPTPSDVFFKVGPYKSLTEDVWAVCSAIMSVSHDRLDRVFVRRVWQGPKWLKSGHSTEVLSPADMARIEEGLRHVMGTV